MNYWLLVIWYFDVVVVFGIADLLQSFGLSYDPQNYSLVESCNWAGGYTLATGMWTPLYSLPQKCKKNHTSTIEVFRNEILAACQPASLSKRPKCRSDSHLWIQ